MKSTVPPIRLLVAGRLVVGLCSALLAFPLTVAWRTDPDQRLIERGNHAAQVIEDLVAQADHAPPQSLLRRAVCVAAVPEVVQVGLGGIGGRAGFGLVSCRTGNGWSYPVFVGLKGGSFGPQIGAQSTDVVLVFMGSNSVRLIAGNSFDIGAQASVAAGPVGRNLSAETDYRLSAEIYSYSKARGLFAGISIAGTKWEIDAQANRQVYGPKGSDVATLLATDGATAPAVGQPFLRSLRKNVGSGSP